MIRGVLRSVCCQCKSIRFFHKYETSSVTLMRKISSRTDAINISERFGIEEDEDDDDFGALARKKGVSVFKLPPELKLPMEKDEEEPEGARFFSEKQPRYYFHKCKKLANQRKWKECLEFFEEKMLKEDQVFPEEFNYSVVIGALGRAGQAKHAFRLYRSLRERALVPSPTVYTALFNSVAQSSDSKDFGRALGLYKKLHRNKIRLNRITYGSLIKVFGRHGTTEQMLGVFREAIVAGFEPDVETFNVILLCLLKHSDTGLREGIQVWRQMIALGIKPNGKSVTYLLKIVKECGIGDPNVAVGKLLEGPDPEVYKDFFKKNIRNIYWLKGQTSTPMSPSVDKLPPTPEIMSLNPGSAEFTDVDDVCEGSPPDNSVATSETSIDDVTDTSMTQPMTTHVPNLLDLPAVNQLPISREVLGVKKDLKPHEKLQLIGGYAHILDMFEDYDIMPTKMVLSSLVWILPGERAAEMAVLDFAAKHKEVREMMVSARIESNYRTFCIVAMSCRKGFYGVSLIKELKENAIEPDEVFFKSLLSAALSSKVLKIENYDDVTGYDYRYLTRILSEMQQLGVKADKQLIAMLEKASDWPEGYNRWASADTDFERNVFKFRSRYREWLRVTEMKDGSR